MFHFLKQLTFLVLDTTTDHWLGASITSRNGTAMVGHMMMYTFCFKMLVILSRLRWAPISRCVLRVPETE